MIDSHHHFWHYNASEYDWIGDDRTILRRDFLPADLKVEIERAGVSGVVSVQARQTLEETRFLLQFANETDWILGVVGWAPFASPEIESILGEFADEKKLKSMRHLVQDEPDGFLDAIPFNVGISALKSFNLIYDLMVVERQLEEAIRFVDRHPNQVFVLDHIAKPLIKDAILEPWKTHITELARRGNVFCKVSGMVTEADWNSWTPESLHPYFDTVLEAFTPSRLMFGTDWPVCLSACDYPHWAQTVRDWATPLSNGERADLFENTARRAYAL